MYSRLFTNSGLFSFGLLLSALHCNGDVSGVSTVETSVESDGIGDVCGRALVSAQVLPDQRTVLRIPEGHPLFGAWVEIPAGSVLDVTSVELAAGTHLTLESGQEALSPSLCVLPHTGSFRKPISVVLPYSGERVRAQGFAPEQLAMATQKLYDLTPASPGKALQPRGVRVPLGVGTTAQIVPGLMAVDTQKNLLGVEVRQAGIYQVISRGMRSPASEPRLDILHVLDNSGSMTPKQSMVARLLPAFFDKVSRRDSTLFSNCIDWHLGALTTDVRNDPASPGDDGQLRQQFCDANKLTGDAKVACMALGCNTLMPLTKPFIERDTTLPYETQKQQYQCLMLVGDQGFGQERPLQALSRFIDREKLRRTPPIAPTTYPFFRDKGLSVVMFLTDENDCSVDPAKAAMFDRPYDPTCTTHSPECYPTNFRCYAMSLKCRGRSDFHGTGRYNDCVEDASGPMKSTQAFADELFGFVTGPKAMGNLGRSMEVGSVMLRAIVPVAGKATDAYEIKDGMGFTDQIAVSFDQPIPASLPTSDPATAFCQRNDGMNSIIGNVQNRVSNFVFRYYNKSHFSGGGAEPLVEIRSICDAESTIAQSLDGLADELQKKDVACRVPIGPIS